VQESQLGDHRILYFRAKNLVITNGSNAPLHIDGDPCESAERFEIRVIPSAFSLLQPV
jgi:diacylglycerol kinase (ATP)